ncbi:Zn-ribbon domain-containing OB-fold protein [Desulfallas sp. Bu1-1]|uniref:Zn-ribbon domain-containing OB-fold protein n=1 Tax=Desulfallas sp. Bu1-1 TaxID=2787620 RepID=UPI00189CAD34|nr:Zn-ribbon domain-containing OB-fold protein [Desulfallas sp. Bu1-1]MBF7082521.1 Zn-ribbon domain-containing OB-fold protein [Desulfallas sp. Bu1-1]
MGFEKFGRISFTSQTKVSEFVDYLEQGELRATRCRCCEKVFFPPRADCASCLGGDMEWVGFNGCGTLVSFTVVNYAPTGFEGDVPYTLALADFNGIKVFGRLSSKLSMNEIKVGMKVKIDVITLPGGQITYQFNAA